MQLAHYQDKQADISDHILRVKTLCSNEREREGGREVGSKRQEPIAAAVYYRNRERQYSTRARRRE